MDKQQSRACCILLALCCFKKEKSKDMFFLPEKGFASLIGLLISLAIICMLLYIFLNNTTGTLCSGSKDGSAAPKSVLDKARSTVKDINKRQSENLAQ